MAQLRVIIRDTGRRPLWLERGGGGREGGLGQAVRGGGGPPGWCEGSGLSCAGYGEEGGFV